MPESNSICFWESTKQFLATAFNFRLQTFGRLLIIKISLLFINNQDVANLIFFPTPQISQWTSH